MLQKKKRGKKVIPEYESFPMSKSTRPKATRIGKTLADNSIKRGCQRCFVAKKPYLDHSLCLLIYETPKHLNAAGEHCHGTMVSGFKYALGLGILEEMKQNIAQMHAYGLSHAQSCNNTPKRFGSWPHPMGWSSATHSCCRLMLGTFAVRGQKNCGRNIHLIPSASVCGQMRFQKTCSTTKSTP